jgi:hypothetical protein
MSGRRFSLSRVSGRGEGGTAGMDLAKQINTSPRAAGDNLRVFGPPGAKLCFQ